MKNRGRRIPLPPVKPGLCRWCGEVARALIDGGVERCERGCLPDDTPERLLLEMKCQDCEGRFYTGASRADQCWKCAENEMASHRRETAAGGNRLTRYQTDMVRRGMDSRRRA